MRHFSLLLSVLCFAHQLRIEASEIPKKLVFDVAETLAREIPRWMAPAVNKKLLIHFKGPDPANQGETRDYFFMKMHYAQEMMTKISQMPNVRIYFYSSDPDYLVLPVLKQLKLTDKSGKSFYDLVKDPARDILLRPDTVDTWPKDDERLKSWYNSADRWKKDLKKISSELNNLLLITPINNHVLKGQENSVVYLGTSLYYAKSYVDAVGERRKNADRIKRKPWLDKYFPKSKEHWFNDFYKNAYVYLLLKEALSASTSLTTSVGKLMQEDRLHLTQVGKSQLDGTWKEESHHWILDTKKEKVLGCQLVQNRTRQKIGLSKLEDCIGDNATEYDWEFDHEIFKVSACLLRDSHSGALIEHRQMSECIQDKKPLSYWRGHKRDDCSLYTRNLYYISGSRQKKCDDKHVLYSPKEKKFFLLKYFKGMEALSLEELIERLAKWSTVSLYKFNYPKEKIGNIDYPRVNHMMYRGMGSGQMDLLKAFRAIFGDIHAVVESKAVTVLKYKLMHLKPPFKYTHPNIDLNDLSSKIRLQEPGPYAHNKALRKAIEALDEEIQKRGDTALKNELVDQRSDSFNEWGGIGLYTAPYYDIAKLYGANVIAFREKKFRGVDKTFFEYKKYNTSNWPAVDSGEYVIPLYIPANEFEGFYLAMSSYFSIYSTNPYEVAYYKIRHKQQTYILEMEADHKQCLIKNIDGFVYYCDSNYRRVPFPAFPSVKALAQARAVIALCPVDQACQVPDEVFKKFNVVSKKPINRVGARLYLGRMIGKKILKSFKNSKALLPSQIQTP